jgi:Protein of unknown function (DUF3892)
LRSVSFFRGDDAEVIEITAIRLAGGQNHEHVAEVLWRSAATALGHGSRQSVIEWLSASSDNRAVVARGSESVQFAVVRESNQAPYLRARKDGQWTDDLLELPGF